MLGILLRNSANIVQKHLQLLALSRTREYRKGIKMLLMTTRVCLLYWFLVNVNEDHVSIVIVYLLGWFAEHCTLVLRVSAVSECIWKDKNSGLSTIVHDFCICKETLISFYQKWNRKRSLHQSVTFSTGHIWSQQQSQ